MAIKYSAVLALETITKFSAAQEAYVAMLGEGPISEATLKKRIRDSGINFSHAEVDELFLSLFSRSDLPEDLEIYAKAHLF